MCAVLKRYFRVPWHSSNPRAFDVLTMVGQPLLASLAGTMIALNTMVFIRMNQLSFPLDIIRFSYGSCAAAAGSFVIFVLAVVYGNWSLVSIGLLCYQLFFVQHIVLSVHLLRTSALDSKVDESVLFILKGVVSVILFIVLLLTVRVTMVCCALTEATMQGGKMWDIDDVKERINSYRQRGHSIQISEED